jgi:microcystin-dependent protein
MNSYLGSLLLVPYNFAPQGWAFCQGQTLPINQNAALFSLIGTFFGGDGVSNFKLPNLPVVTSTGGGELHWVIAMQGVFPSRD